MMKKSIKNLLFKLLPLSIIACLMLALSVGGGYGAATAAETSDTVNRFKSDYATRDEAKEAGRALNIETVEEGVVLLKNEDNALPLSEGAKISVFGKNSANLLLGNYDYAKTDTVIPIQDALSEAGFQINPSLVSFYNDSGASGSGRGGNKNQKATGETPVSSYTSVLENSYANYDDAALIFITRVGAESADMSPNVGVNEGFRDNNSNYLQLDKNETDLIKYVGDRFENVVVLFNFGTQFEAGFLDDPTHYGYHKNVKAAIWMGLTGANGSRGLVNVLKGTANPSGRTVDLWQRNLRNDPTFKNFGDHTYTEPYHYGDKYVEYAEGIYVGYRYYETRGYTEAQAGNTDWYGENVVYPFGYGLSYTTFSQEIIAQEPAAGTALTEDGTINLTVRVINTGDVEGKEVVQLYYTSPYTEGEIEKSHVALGSFEKTESLKPGEHEDVRISLKVRDMASYDYNDANTNGIKGYELEDGTYTVKIMKNSHDLWGSVDYSVTSDIHYATDVTGYKIENRFDNVSKYITRYLSRADWEGTFPETGSKIRPQWVTDELKEHSKWETSDNSKLPSDEDKPWYTDKMPTTGDDTASNGVVLSDLTGLPYDDPLWETFLDQFSKETMRDIAGEGGYVSGKDIPELGLTRIWTYDTTSGWRPSHTSSGTYVSYGCVMLFASTFNKDIAYRRGREMGNEGFFGDGSSKSMFPGWYCPAVNLHRSAFGGRNFEYFSEDSYLSGIIAAKMVEGGNDKGMISYVKHFAVNDQETNRSGVLTWANEQSMRELYFKPFEICVKEGKATAIMTAFNRIGTTWAGGDYQLLTEVLRNEWGFNGIVLTDGGSGSYMNPNLRIRSGGGVALATSYKNNDNNYTATVVSCLRKITHDVCYAHANSMAMYTGLTNVPYALSNYTGGFLSLGIMNIPYNESVAKVTFNKDGPMSGQDESLIKYSLVEDSRLPEGLTLNEDGTITGTPVAEISNHMFKVRASYDTYKREATFTISVTDPNGSIVYPSGMPLSVATVNEEYENSVATAYIYKEGATDSEISKFPQVTYTLKNGSLLPDGLTLSPDGILSGTPDKICKDYSFTVVASALGFKAKESTWTISVFNELSFSSATLAAGKFGMPYAAKVAQAECDGKVTYELKTGSTLPDGLELTAGGYITGTPMTVVTDHKFTVLAVSEFAETEEVEYSITIGLSYKYMTLADGREGTEYEALADFAQGSNSITYSFAEGSDRPEGLTLSADGTLSGTPLKAGVYNIVIEANANGAVGDSIRLTLYIANAEKSDGCGGAVLTTVSVAGVVCVASGAIAIFLKMRKKRNGK